MTEPLTLSARGTPSRHDFLSQMGTVWIGLLETTASEPDQLAAIGEYFELPLETIQDWIALRGRYRCAGNAQHAGRCANIVGTTIEYDPRVWAAQAHFCSFHALTPAIEEHRLTK